MKRIIFHVTENKREGGWNIKKEGNKNPLQFCHTQGRALDTARRMARKLPNAQVKLHGRNGRVRDSWNYG